MCYRCEKRRWYLRHPIEYRFARLKMDSKRRGIGFELTIEDFREFCNLTGYHVKSGCTPESLTIDRIRPGEPYKRGNIRIATHQINSIRQDDEDLSQYPGGEPF